MKSAFLGTNHPNVDDETEDLLRQAGVDYLQRIAGYAPSTTPSRDVLLPPCTRHKQETIDSAMTILCGREVHNCNPRSPYLMLVWILIGSTNEFRVTGYAESDSLLRPVAHLLLQMAIGETIELSEFHAVVNNAWKPRASSDDTVWPLWADEAIAWAAWTMECEDSVFVRAIETVIWAVTRTAIIQATESIHKQARQWCHIEDEQAHDIIKSLLLDSFDAQEKS